MLFVRNHTLGVGWWVYTGNRHGSPQEVTAQEHDGLVKRQLIVSARDQNAQSAPEHRGGVSHPDGESQRERAVKVVQELTS